MTKPRTSRLVLHKPDVTGHDARADLLDRNIRATVPLRKIFVQRPRGEIPRHGPLQTFVTNGDLRGLRAYLTVVAASGGQDEERGGWVTELDSLVWGRLFDAEETAAPPAARTAAWRTLGRLEDRGLVEWTRKPGSRTIAVKLLREDGTGTPYTRPTGEAVPDRFLRLPVGFWKRGYDARVTLPGLAMLLALAAERPWSSFPLDRMDEWYGWSGDSAQRDLKNLRDLELVERRESYRKAALSPSGSTLVYQYRLVRWMRPPAGARPDGGAKWP